ncbi:MAG: hypothetical protein HQK62_13460, partial [Desulfamplus sp.]|nr:hypothetical protein [Desulfamplus sp.]
GFDVNQYETVYVLKSGELYYAFNSNTSDEIIQKLQQALDDLKRMEIAFCFQKKMVHGL